jgi:hypothetical protein
MTSTFSTTNLVGERVLVQGTDVNGISGKTILDSSQFNELKGNSAHDAAHEAFDAAVKEFWAPITEAAETLAAAHVAVEDIFVEKIADASPAVPARSAEYVRLTPDTVILRRIEAGETDGLIWVGDNLEIAA